MIQSIYANATSSPTKLGGGKHGHIGLIMSSALYATLFDSTYIAPIDPGAVQQYERNLTNQICKDTNNIFNEQNF